MRPRRIPAPGDIEIWEILQPHRGHPSHPLPPGERPDHPAGSYLTSGDHRTVSLLYRARSVRPTPNEIGWKETVRMNPGEVTTVIMQVQPADPAGAAMGNPLSPRTGGHEYVWHCHILEHEEHDMMRPLVVT